MIRAATEEDLLVLVQLAKEYHKESPFRDIAEYDEESAGIMFLYCIENHNGYVSVLEKDGHIAGYFMAFNMPSLFNRNILTSQQVSWYVSNKYRSTESIQMFRKWEEWAMSEGCKVLSVGSKFKDTATMNRVIGKDYMPLETMLIRGC